MLALMHTENRLLWAVFQPLFLCLAATRWLQPGLGRWCPLACRPRGTSLLRPALWQAVSSQLLSLRLLSARRQTAACTRLQELLLQLHMALFLLGPRAPCLALRCSLQLHVL